MFKKAGRFQTETRARRNQRETEAHASNREAADALESTKTKGLTVAVAGEFSSERIGVLRKQFENIFAIVDCGTAAGFATIDYFIGSWNAASPSDRLALVHLKCQLVKQGHIVEQKRGIARKSRDHLK